MSIWLQYEIVPDGYLSAGRSGEVMNDRQVHAVLPGSVVRGALAGAWWTSGIADTGQAAFDALFDGQLVVEAAIPALDGRPAELRPMGWARCKYPDQNHGGWRENLRSPAHRCECAQPLVAGKGWEVPDGVMTLTTRTQLEGGAAKDGALFTRRAVPPTVRFSGFLRIDSDIDQEQMEWLLASRRLSIGGQRSVMGRCTWTCCTVPDPLPLPDGTGPFVLTVLQPAILLDRFGASSMDLAGAVQDLAETKGGQLKLGPEVVVRTTQVSGWHGLAGIPKPTEWALEVGSSVWIEQTDATALEALRSGIGIRRNEGYGAVSITVPGHQPGYGCTPPVAARSRLEPTIGHPPAADPGMGSGQAAESDRHRIIRLLDRFPEEERQSISGRLRRAAEAISRKPGPARASEADRWLTQPWAATLAEDLRSELKHALIAPDSKGTINALRGWRP